MKVPHVSLLYLQAIATVTVALSFQKVTTKNACLFSAATLHTDGPRQNIY